MRWADEMSVQNQGIRRQRRVGVGVAGMAIAEWGSRIGADNGIGLRRGVDSGWIYLWLTRAYEKRENAEVPLVDL